MLFGVTVKTKLSKTRQLMFNKILQQDSCICEKNYNDKK